LDELNRLIGVNSSDPNAKSLQELSEKKGKARARLTVLPLRGANRANLLLDGKRIDTDGQVTSLPITIDQHTVSVRTPRYGELPFTTEQYLAEGEAIELVYDDSVLRKATQEDKILPPSEPQEETSRKFDVKHPHNKVLGISFNGNCRGTLNVSSARIQYATKSADHNNSWEAQTIVSLTVEGGKTLIIKTKDNNIYKYEAEDAKSAKEIQEFWKKVQKTAR
jgi:hypothetical protein